MQNEIDNRRTPSYEQWVVRFGSDEEFLALGEGYGIDANGIRYMPMTDEEAAEAAEYARALIGQYARKAHRSKADREAFYTCFAMMFASDTRLTWRPAPPVCLPRARSPRPVRRASRVVRRGGST